MTEALEGAGEAQADTGREEATALPATALPATALPACLVICGPTAAGKTQLVLALGGVVDLLAVSADSRQIYRGFDIGTAKPTASDLRSVPHACLDLAAPTARYSAYAWATEAQRALEISPSEERVRVVVGGAGFYVRALVHPVTSQAPAGAERVAAHYLVVDPGVPLRDRIAVRAERMLKLGWPEEVAALAREVPPDAVAWKACGYAAMRGYVEGRLSRAAALEQITISTRQYAKRQRTWFRHQLWGDRVTRLNPDDADAVPRAMAWLRRHTASPVGVP